MSDLPPYINHKEFTVKFRFISRGEPLIAEDLRGYLYDGVLNGQNELELDMLVDIEDGESRPITEQDKADFQIEGNNGI